MNTIHLTDGYKVDHRKQYPAHTNLVYSNWTARKSRLSNIDHIVFFGLQYFVKKYLIEDFQKNFFDQPIKAVISKYKRRISYYLGPDAISYEHIKALHQLGYLPLEIKAVDEGTLVPIRTPALTVRNTHPEFFWLTNFFETIMSTTLWMPCTSATTAFHYRKLLESAARYTGGPLAAVDWQAHDFSFRGLAGLEAAMMSGAAHLLSFTGTDTIPAIDFLEKYYHANVENELVGGSVPATEHSVMCMGMESEEIDTFSRLIKDVYPKGIVSIVSDSWDFWRVMTEYLPSLKEAILARDGKVVIRPDSGDPVKIVCGDPNAEIGSPEYKGAIELLWELFGGSDTEKGFKLLDSHIGLIYGDSITPERCRKICDQLIEKGFCTTNIVLGVGSYSYQYVTRDTFGFAMKATYGEINGVGREIFKDPKTDNGVKKSAKGLIKVLQKDGVITGHIDGVDWEQEKESALTSVFLNGKLIKNSNLAQIRNLVRKQLKNDSLYHPKNSGKSQSQAVG